MPLRCRVVKLACAFQRKSDALQTLREFGGAVGSRGSAWTAAACRRHVRRAGKEPGPRKAWCGGRIPPKPPFLPMEGRLSCRPAPRLSDGAAWVVVWAGMGPGLPTERPRVHRESGRLRKADVGRWMRAAGRIRVRSSGLASLGSGPGGCSVGFGDLLAQQASAPDLPVQPPRQRVPRQKCTDLGASVG